MGSFHATCGISQLAIRPYEKVALFLLIRQPQRDRYQEYAYANELYQPIAPAIICHYGDYQEYHDIDLSDVIVNELFKYGLSTKNQITTDDLEKHQIYAMPVHLNIYNDIVHTFGSDISPRDYHKTVKQSMSDVVDDYLKQMESLPDDSPSPPLRYLLNQDISDMLKYVRSDHKLYDDTTDMFVFIRAMEELRKFWHPQTGAGSQSLDFRIAMLIGEFAKKKDKELSELLGE